MRLIDADALVKDLSYLYTKNHIPVDMRAKEILTTIMEQPTAYSVDKVVEELEEVKKRRSEDYGYMADIHQSIGYRKALDDFVETLVSAFDETNIKEYGFYPENLVRQVAKQLKEGN